MAIYSRGLAAKFLRLDGEHVIQVYLGEELLWDGTVPAQVFAARATASAMAHAPVVSSTPNAVTAVDAEISLAGIAPVISAGSTITAVVATISAAAHAPAVTADAVVTAPVATISVEAIPIVTDATVNAPTALATAQGLVPDVATTGSAVVAPPTATITLDAPVPIVSASKSVVAPIASISVAATAPVVGGGATITAPTATVSAAATAPAVTAVNFQASGMNKATSTHGLTTSYAQVNTWVADTSGYPGSTVSSHSLVVNGTKGSATLEARAAFTSSLACTCTLRIFKNGVLAVQGSASASSTNGAATASGGSISVSNGDLITLQAIASNNFGSISIGTGTYVRCT